MTQKDQSSSKYDPTKKQKSAEKTSRIPIKIVPIEEVLKKDFARKQFSNSL